MQIRIRKHLRNLFWGTYEDIVNPALKRNGSEWVCSERVFENAFCIGQVFKTNPVEILDIGCARSSFPLELCTLGYKVTGIDLRDYFMQHPNLKFIQGDFSQMTFNNKFDLVTCISVFEHVGLGAYNEPPDKAKVARFVGKMIEAIAPGGHLILTLPLNSYQPGFVNRYTLQDIKKYFEKLELTDSPFFEYSNGIYVKTNHFDKEVTACLVFKNA